MKKLSSICLLVLLLVSCQSADDDSVTIQGTVQDNDTGVGLENAAVIISSSGDLNGTFTSSDSTGAYIFRDLNVSEATDLGIRASLSGYETLTKNVTALPGQLINLNFNLVEETDDTPDPGTGDGGGDDIVEGEPGVPAAITLLNVSEESINIRQTGGISSTTFSFVIQDSAGRAMDASSPVTVNFRIINGPDGGEAVVPTTVETNDEGKVVTSLFSGDSAGVVRVEAYINREDGETISSKPVLVAIHGGFPSSDHFFVSTPNRNIEGYGYIYPEAPENIYSIIASVGDRFGNPVKQGTSVDFRSLNSGIVQGSAVTNDDGFAGVRYFPNGATPSGHPNGIGFFDVQAHTVDEDNNSINRTITLLFTTRTAIITFTDTDFDVPANGSDNVAFTVTDLNGYPMAAGTTISVSSTAGIEVAGDASVKLGDYFTGGLGVTEFTITLSDIDETSSATVASSVTVTVTTPSGNQTTATLSGTRAKIRK